MRKAKVVAIVCGMIASCLFGGFAVVEAATITLDDSSTTELVEMTETTRVETTAAATETSIKTTAPVTTSTTTISETEEESSEDTEETTEAPETTAPETDADPTDTTAVQTAATHAGPLEVYVPSRANSTTAKPAETTAATTKATTKATTAATTKATTKTTTVTTTTTVPVQTTTVAVEEPTAPPMPEQTVGYVAGLDDPVHFEIPAVEEETPVVETPSGNGLSDSDYILLCNAVAHEAGANNINATEKTKVVEVIMNRVASPKYPNTIYGVLTQKYQFSGSSTYVNLNTFSPKVTDLVKEAVDLYFADPSAFSEGYLSFTGDGVRNYFR